jgi:Highly conserved protein containing a thioredoxin domain
MERESFEDEGVAALLNERFVSVKVDREERPDVDDVYMSAVQTMVGRGGWPLSAFLFPDGRPFFGGTYFPREDRRGQAGFRTILEKLSEAWRSGARSSAREPTRSSRRWSARGVITDRAGREPLTARTGNVLTETLKRTFDARHGGFGGAPKFPPHLALEWLLLKGVEGDSIARSMALKTLDEMALGGIHDHLAGGFHRYSTDERWLLPHFEKMLTDNAQLLALYARAFVLTGRDLYWRTARGIGDWLLAEMRGDEGGFFAATDADSEGEEGRYFVSPRRRCARSPETTRRSSPPPTASGPRGTSTTSRPAARRAGTSSTSPGSPRPRRSGGSRRSARACSSGGASASRPGPTTSGSRAGTPSPSPGSPSPRRSSASRATSTPPAPRRSSS